MQIHEITLKPVAEGVLKDIGSSLGRQILAKSGSTIGVSADQMIANSPKDPAPAATPDPTPDTPDTTGQSWQGQNIDVPAVQRKQASQQTSTPDTTGQSWQGQNVDVPAVQRKQASQPSQPTSTPARPRRGIQKVQTKAAPTTTPNATKPVVIKDKTGVSWTYAYADRKWRGPDNNEVTDPVSIQKLNKAAEVQFQNRQMAQK